MIRCRRILHLVLVVTLTTTGTWAFAVTPLEDALRLQREGRNREAQRALRALLPELRAANDLEALGRALAATTDASIALGEYEPAIQEAQEAFDVHQRLGQRVDAAWDLNAVGLANLYLGRYDEALASYQRALEMDRAGADGDGEITRLNNIGNVHHMRGRYADALRLYEQALAAVDTRTSEKSRARLRKMTISNLALLHQRLGADERALDLYGQLRSGETMQPSEEAQLLINQGWLFRRLGDPAKAMQTYRQGQALFARAGHRDGEISAWRNIGLVYALDLDDNQKALEAFDAGLKLARESSNQRGEVQALLYRGETLRRIGRLTDAARELQSALDSAVRVGLVEEQWKALYSLGRAIEAQGKREDARRSYEQAITAIESVRADLQTVALKSEFLADKRDIYDALIRLRLSDQSASVADVFTLIEQSRARTWQDRLHTNARRVSLGEVQPKIAAGAMLLEFWSTDDRSAVLWMTNSASGVVQLASSRDEIAQVQRLSDAVSRDGDDWRTASVAAGRILLSGLPDMSGVSRLLVVPDGPLHDVPFEALTVPNAHDLLVERFGISYLPSAAFLVERNARDDRGWKWPWERTLVAFGTALPRLPYASEEIRAIAASLPGRSVVHDGAGAQKHALYQALTKAPPVLHFSTHAIADIRDPERSRILLASATAGESEDSLFLREIYDLDLTGVQLATLSACDTERGKVIRGEGVEGFSRALLAAGAATAITTRWEVVDRAGAEFMKQFYFALAGGETEASAMRHAKLQFLHSQLAWSHPRYWAGYVLTGDGRERLPRVVPWIALLSAFALIALAIGVASAGNWGVTLHAPSSQIRPKAPIGSEDMTWTVAPGGGAIPKSSDNSSASR